MIFFTFLFIFNSYLAKKHKIGKNRFSEKNLHFFIKNFISFQRKPKRHSLLTDHCKRQSEQEKSESLNSEGNSLGGSKTSFSTKLNDQIASILLSLPPPQCSEQKISPRQSTISSKSLSNSLYPTKDNFPDQFKHYFCCENKHAH